MSVYCRVASPTLLLKALSAISLHRDSWSTVIFTENSMVMHVEGNDQTTTATAMVPKEVFSEYVVSDARLSVHLGTFVDALLLLGGGALSTASTRVTIMFPTADAKLLVELSDHHGGGSSDFPGSVGSGGQRTLTSKLVTRPVKDTLLDLRFRDALLGAQVTVLGDALRDVIQDLTLATCVDTTLVISPQSGVELHGERGRYGEVDILLKRHSDAVLSLDDERVVTSASRTRVSTAHLALACGVKSAMGGGAGGGGGGGRGGGRSIDALFSSSAGGGTAGAGISGFERLTLQINANRQLSVVHMQRDTDIKVVVTVVVTPLYDYEGF